MQGLSLPQPLFSKLPAVLLRPEDEDDPALEERTPPRESVEEGKRTTRVLVVDDAPDVLEMFGMMLRISGYEVTVATSAKEALDEAAAAQFDIIVSDIGMPEMNGYELCKRLRAFPGYKSVPMIAVTGFAQYKDRDQALASGFNEYLTKPVNPVTLLNLIEKLRE